MGDQEFQFRIAVEDTAEPHACECDCGFHGKAEAEGEDVAVFGGAGAVNGGWETVVGVEEDEEGVGFEGCPDGIESWVIETGAEACGAEDYAFDVGEGFEAGDFFYDGLRRGGEGESREGVDFACVLGG